MVSELSQTVNCKYETVNVGKPQPKELFAKRRRGHREEKTRIFSHKKAQKTQKMSKKVVD